MFLVQICELVISLSLFLNNEYIALSNNAVLFLLKVFFVNVSNGEGLDKTLVKKSLQFRENLTKRYHWDFTSEPDEDAPVVVDLNQS